MNLIKKLWKSILVVFLFAGLITPYQISVKAEDTEEVITTIDDYDTGTGLNQFQFEGTWIPASGVGVDYKGTEHWTNKGRWGNTLPSFTIKFKGNKIELFGKKDKDLCIYKAVIDGDEAKAEEFDAYNVTSQTKERLYVKEGLSEGEHTIKVYVQNKMNAMAATDVLIGAQIDYAKVYAEEKIDPNKTFDTYINDATTGSDMFQYSFSSGWSVSSGYPDAFYKGDEHWGGASASAEPYFDLNFHGSKIQLFGVKESSSAFYDVSIDGGEAQRVDPYSSTRQTQQKIFEKDGLAEGPHKLRLTIKNAANAANTTGRRTGEIDYAIATHKLISATGIDIDQESVTVEAGLTANIVAKSTPSYATNANIIYKIADESIATISNTGEITGLKAGTTKVLVSLKGTSFVKEIPLVVTPEGSPLIVSVGNEYMLETQENYKDVVDDSVAAFTAKAWRGDVINSKINTVSKGKAIHNATMKVSDFKNGTATIKADNVEAYWLKETMANIGRGSTGAPVKAFPDIMHTDKSVDIKAKKVQSAWININVPKDAKPGTYTGSITVEADELEEPFVISYTFEVIDLVQPTTDDTGTSIQVWQHPFAVASYWGITKDEYFTEKHLNLMRESMREYKNMGGRDVVANIVEEAWNHQSETSDPTMVAWTKKADGTFTYDYTLFDRWINFNVEEGVLDPANGLGQIKCYSIVPWGNQITYYDEASKTTKQTRPNPGTDAWKSFWTPFLTDFMKHVEDKGWFDITYIAMDERGINDLKEAVALIETIKNEKDESFLISSAMNYQSPSDYDFTDKIHDISINQGNVSSNNTIFKDLATHREAKGLITTVYTCTGDYPSNYTISDPAENAWSIWFSLSQGATGYMRWAWDNWVSDPLTSVNYKFWEPGDGWFIYPTEKGKTSDTYFYKTPRYEMLKQAVRDQNKARYLMELSDDVKGEVNELVTSLKRPKNGGNGYGSAVAASQAERVVLNNEVVRMREGVMDISKEYVNSLIVPVTSIEVSASEVNLEVEDTTTITAVVKPDNATNKDVIWESDNTAVASVVDGKITAKAKGTATITVYNNDRTIKADIKVTVIENEDTIFMKGILKSAIDKAQILVDSDQFDTLAPSVATLIQNRLADAKTVYANENATKVQVMNAWFDLAEALQYSDFVANKADLKALIAMCDAIDTSMYNIGVEAFEKALAEAKVVFNDDGVLQESIDAAFTALSTAKDGLATKVVDKTTLSNTVKDIKAKVGDGSLYKHDAAWDAFQKALKDAEAVLENPTASAEDVNAALLALSSAYADIRLLPNEAMLKELEDFLNTVKKLDAKLYSASDYAFITKTASRVEAIMADFNETAYYEIQGDLSKARTLIETGKLATPENPKDQDSTNGHKSANTSDTTTISFALGMVLLSSLCAVIVLKKRKIFNK